jgi:hypothetical protein
MAMALPEAILVVKYVSEGRRNECVFLIVDDDKQVSLAAVV